jgi:hypothetical protein
MGRTRNARIQASSRKPPASSPKPRASSPKPRASSPSVHEQFTTALDGLIERVKEDRSILAAILGGSLSHDRVWAKSDIDLVLVTIDDKLTQSADAGVALHADGVNIHALLMPRAALRKMIAAAVHNSFMHSFLAKGRLLYTHDPSIADLFATLNDIGERDTRLQLLQSGAGAVYVLNKAHKWFVTRGDLEYTALWILYAANSLARIEILSRRQLTDREVIPQAMRLNPAFFKVVYGDLLNTKKTRRNVQAALEAMDEYLKTRTTPLFGLVIEYLREIGEARSATELETHFERNFNVSGVTAVCEYLADQGLIGQASTPVRLTKRSNIDVQELAFYYTGSRLGA